jgi:(2Fe-2S) ferredoxin
MAIKRLQEISHHLFICNGGTCKQKGAEEGIVEIRNCIRQAGLEASVHTTKTFCNGRCNDGPIVISATDGLWFKGITKEKAGCLVQEFLLKGTLPGDLVLYRYGLDFVNEME